MLEGSWPLSRDCSNVKIRPRSYAKAPHRSNGIIPHLGSSSLLTPNRSALAAVAVEPAARAEQVGPGEVDAAEPVALAERVELEELAAVAEVELVAPGAQAARAEGVAGPGVLVAEPVEELEPQVAGRERV